MLRGVFQRLLTRRSNPDQRFRVAVFNDTRPTRHVGCSLVMRELIANLRAEGLDPVFYHPVREDWREVAQNIPRKGAIDAIVVNGEGSIHNPATRPRAQFLSELGPFARDVLDVPSFLVNATIFALDATSADNLRAFDQIFVRESSSQKELSGYDIPSVVVPDLTVQAEVPLASQRAGIAATDSVIAESRTIIKTLCKEHGYAYRSMVSIPKDISKDAAAYQHAADYARWLSSHELVLTGRFHTVTLCIATGTPFITVESNTPKISSFVSDVLGSTRRLVAPEKLHALDLQEFYPWRPEELVAVRNAVANARSASRRMFDTLRNVVSSRSQAVEFSP